jgi:HD-GYP domain-containing protein (c-di-GMP phosphodiesterase class II)
MKHSELDEGESYRSSIAEALNRALFHYDEATANHSVRTGALAGRLATRLDLDRFDCTLVTQAGIVHDVGKLAIRLAVLHKTGPLTAEEQFEVERHSRIGTEMLLGISSDLAPIAEGVGSHHERWDGTGYPDGLAGEEIPLFGRVLAVADVYDALTNTRVYRKWKYTPDAALTYVEEHAGTEFDPKVVVAMLDLLRR